ncbi:MAG TPA: phytoene/squalene synthase family protein [Ramlibacter sp.]|nr:phytoene/squalene synthase family protein [Ramlibacter sp.]
MALLRGVSRSFYVSIRLLPAELRRPIALAYLLARATDTVADTATVATSARSEMLGRLARLIDGASANMVGNELPTLQEHLDGNERELILALPHCLEGLATLDAADRADVQAVLRTITQGQLLDLQRFGDTGSVTALESAAQLDEYTYLVAGCVGEFWTELCSRHLAGFAKLPELEMRRLGRSYGMGLQLVNVLRDLGNDLASGRCYLPADELRTLGLDPADILARPDSVKPVWDLWLARAQLGLDDGMRYAHAVNHRRVRAASAMPALLGARTLALLRMAGPGVAIARKVKVPRSEVRSMMAAIAFTLAGRSSLQRQFERMQRGTSMPGWDNPRT